MTKVSQLCWTKIRLKKVTTITDTYAAIPKRRCVCFIGYRTILGKTVNYMSTLARNVTELHIISKHVAPGLENLLFASESIDYELLGTDRL